MNFHVGQEVVCIRKTPWLDYWGFAAKHGPKHPDVLVITDIEKSPLDDKIGLSFAEWPNEYFVADYFRPVVKSKNQKGMKILRKILKTTKTDEKV